MTTEADLKTIAGEVGIPENRSEKRLLALVDDYRDLKTQMTALTGVLATVLDQVDYTHGACRMNEMVAEVLPIEIINLARAALNRWRNTHA